MSALKQFMPQKRSRLFKELVVKSWWTILFLLISLFAYDEATKRRVREEQTLQSKLQNLLLANQEALALQEELKREIASEQDSCWIELVLMEKLGLVPEGQTKVHFKSITQPQGSD